MLRPEHYPDEYRNGPDARPSAFEPIVDRLPAFTTAPVALAPTPLFDGLVGGQGRSAASLVSDARAVLEAAAVLVGVGIALWLGGVS